MVKLGRRTSTLAGHMSPDSVAGVQLLRMVTQALGRVCEDRERVLAAALERAKLEAVPDEAGPLTNFVFGALRDTVADEEGVEEADAVVRSLRPLLNVKAEGLEKELQENASPSSPAPGEDNRPMALVIHTEVAARAKIARMLKAHGCRGMGVPDANMALAMCVRVRPALVIALLGDEDPRGKQLSALLKVAFGSDAPPIVALTDEGDDDPNTTGVFAAVKASRAEEALGAAVAEILAADSGR